MSAPPIHTFRHESHMWPAPASTFLVRDSEGGAIIDIGCGEQEGYRSFREFLASHGLLPCDIHTVVLSHAHPDHMGAVPFLLEEAEPRIFIHPLEEELAREPRLLNESFDMGHIARYYRERLGDADPESVDIIDYFSRLCPMGSAEATDLIEEGDTVSLGGRDLEVIHTPGHAPGHVCFYDRSERLLLSGDLVGAVVAWYCPSGGGAEGYLDSLEKIESLPTDIIIPSHGEDIRDVKGAIERTRDVITSREERILEMLAGGTMRLLEITDRLFPNPATRMFPGLQITDSHLIKLEKEGRLLREENESAAFFRLAREDSGLVTSN